MVKPRQGRNGTPVHVAFLLAVNVGGTGKLPMVELKAMCHDLGFSDVQTYIASGNLLFRSSLGAGKARAALEQRLQAYAGKPVGVVMRTVAELADVLRSNPFPHAVPSRTVAIFLDDIPPPDTIRRISGRNREEQIGRAHV